LYVMGFAEMGLFVVLVSLGSDFLGRTPRQILLLRRLRQRNRRWRKLRRIEKAGAELAETNPKARPTGSRLGFTTQVDEFGAWMRDEDLRGWVRTAGFVAADIQARYRANLSRRGVPLPKWPDTETRGAPGPTPAPEPKL
jgi:hypothetical protein